jgi:hypothetical protein
VRGLEHFTRTPATLVLFNHLRDADPPIVANALFGGRALLAPGRTVPAFVARDDMFRPGFLARYLPNLPAPLRWALARLDLRPVFSVLRAYPIRRVAEYTLREALEDVLLVLGNAPLERVLREGCREQFERRAPRAGAGPTHGPLCVRDALSDRYGELLSQTDGFHKLTRGCFAALKPFEESVIESQLGRLVRALEGGAIVQMAPEGAISLGGQFGRVRGGLQELLEHTGRQVRVLPVGISYDFLMSGRVRAFVGVGPELAGDELKRLRPQELSGRVTRAILAQNTVTASHLASALCLRVGAGGVFTLDRLLEHVEAGAARWAAVGVGVDPRLLDGEARERQVGAVVRYMARKGLLVPLGDGSYRLPPAADACPRRRGGPNSMVPPVSISFISNHLASLEEVFADAAPMAMGDPR